MAATLIIADDLSGAADCAVAWVAVGRETAVVLNLESDQIDASVVSVDNNTRTMNAGDAAIAAAAVLNRFRGVDTGILYQKMDSTLRGNWVSELVQIRRTVASASGRMPFAIVAPAFPAAGRTTVNGCVLVDGTPLQNTEIWRREGSNGQVDLRAALQGAGLKVELAKLDQAVLAPESLSARFESWSDQNCDALVCDAQSEDDLLRIAKATLALPVRPLWVGSAGLMRAIVSAAHAEVVPSSEPARRLLGRPLLTVVGSASGVSRMQFEALILDEGVASVKIPTSALRANAGSGEVLGYVQALDQALARGSDVAVTVASDEFRLQEGPQLADALAAVIAPRLPRVGGLIVTGGETARSILVKAGVTGLQMKGEIQPGVPFGRSIGTVAIPVVTKAGAFGDRSTLVRCYRVLNGHTSGQPGSA